MPLLRRAARRTRSWTSACRRCARASSASRRSTPAEPSTRCTPTSAASASSCSSRQFVPPEEIFTRVRLLLVLLGLAGWRTRALRRAMSERFGARRAESQVVEIASNDGYLLQYFVERGIPVLGIEPAANVAQGGRGAGHRRRWCEFFGSEPGARSWCDGGLRADLVIGNNVLAQVPDLNDFVAGTADAARRRRGVADDGVPAPAAADGRRTSSTPSTTSTSPTSRSAPRSRIFAAHGLTLFDVEEIAHARRLAAHLRPARRGRVAPVERARREPARRASRRPGLDRLGLLPRLRRAGAARCKRDLLRVPHRREAARASGRRLRRAGQGQHAAQLLRRSAPISSTSRSTAARYKQGRSCPARASRSTSPTKILETRPDYVLILPWNLKDEIMEQMAGDRRVGRALRRGDPRDEGPRVSCRQC